MSEIDHTCKCEKKKTSGMKKYLNPVICVLYDLGVGKVTFGNYTHALSEWPWEPALTHPSLKNPPSLKTL